MAISTIASSVYGNIGRLRSKSFAIGTQHANTCVALTLLRAVLCRMLLNISGMPTERRWQSVGRTRLLSSASANMHAGIDPQNMAKKCSLRRGIVVGLVSLTLALISLLLNGTNCAASTVTVVFVAAKKPICPQIMLSPFLLVALTASLTSSRSVIPVTVESGTSPSITAQAAAQELLRRRKARANLLNFVEFTFPQYVPEPVHELMGATLDRVAARELRRVMIFAPPQHGKSELVSVRLPAYWLGRHPDDPIILTSYGADLAGSKSRQARNLVESDEYQRLFPDVGTPRDSRAVNEWSIAGRRGGMLAAGVGGPITGHGAMLGIIDDPFENWEQAQSQTYRDRVWDWYKSTFRTRILEAGVIILIMTRWHEDDLAGRLIGERGDEWTILRLPALAETQEERDENDRRLGLPTGQPDLLGRAPGEPLAPKRFSIDALASLKRDVGSLVWNAEYQGSPRAPEGNRFKRSWFEIVNVAPTVARRVRYWDKAGTAGGGAFTAGVLMAAAGGQYFIEDVVRGQWSALERETTIKQTAQLDQQRGHVEIWHEQEPGSGGKESAESTTRNLAGFSVHAERPTGNKDVRMEPLAAQAEAGNVKLVRGLWNGPWLDEITAIPNGAFRDQGDGSSGAFNKLVNVLDGKLIY